MNVIKHKNIFFVFSGTLIVLSLAAIILYKPNFGIDFLGGTLWQVRLRGDKNATTDDLKKFLADDLKIKDPIVYSETTTQSFLIRMTHVSEAEHQSYLQALKNGFGGAEELRFDTIGPAVGKDLQQKAVMAIVLVLFGISLYVTVAFRKVSYPIKSWKYGMITLFTLFHDVFIPLGLFAVLGHWSGVEIDINFVVAILVIMGFSVHDTIVVFDRIRENLLHNRQTMTHGNLGEVIDLSINQTMARSINTSLTLIIVLLAMFFLGPASLKYFVLAILVGVTVGAYSSIFIASPALLIISGVKRAR